MNDRFRDESGRLVPAHVFLAALHSDFFRDLTSLLAVGAFVVALVCGADWWVHG